MEQFFSIKQKVRLAKSLFTKTSPAYVQFYITARCNLACEQCNIIYADADSNEMSIDQIREVAKNLAEIGVCIVLLIGGEPFARKDIADIVQCFTDVGIHVRMQTNGFATKKLIQNCVEAGGHDISISLDSLDLDIQEKINGGYSKSFIRALKTVTDINDVFPKNGSAFFGTVLMPRNINHIKDVIEFATKIGWGVSLVPAHISTTDRPQGFRTFDDLGVCRFPKSFYPRLKEVLDEIKIMKKNGYNIYDSDEYLDDIYRFLVGENIQWRKKNNNVCDSPNLYFAIEPNGNIKPCCDFKLDKSFPVYHEDFPKLYQQKKIHESVYSITRDCAGCMYGSYPEISITSHSIKPFVERFLYFKNGYPELKKFEYDEILDITQEIFSRNKKTRDIEDNKLNIPII